MKNQILAGNNQALLPLNENRDNTCKRGKGEGLPCQFILECRARLLEKKKIQNKGVINSIFALINKRLAEFRSEMITLINKNGDQPISLGDKDSYYEDFETR